MFIRCYDFWHGLPKSLWRIRTQLGVTRDANDRLGTIIAIGLNSARYRPSRYPSRQGQSRCLLLVQSSALQGRNRFVFCPEHLKHGVVSAEREGLV